MCSKKRTVLRERSFQEQITSLEHFLSILSHLMKALVFFILQISFAKRAVLEIGEYRWIFSHVTRLDQSYVGEQK